MKNKKFRPFDLGWFLGLGAGCLMCLSSVKGFNGLAIVITIVIYIIGSLITEG